MPMFYMLLGQSEMFYIVEMGHSDHFERGEEQPITSLVTAEAGVHVFLFFLFLSCCHANMWV